jgi:glutathione S-transferase
LNWNAVCALKVVLCLEEKGLAYTERPIDLGRFDQLQDWYLKLNPAGVVPTLVHDDEVVVESTIIGEYLDDAFRQPSLRPADPLALARMRWWTKQVEEVIHPSLRPLSFTRFATEKARSLSDDDLSGLRERIPKKELGDLWWRVAKSPYSAEELGAYRRKVEQTLALMEVALTRSSWLVGEQFSLADIAFIPYFRRIGQLGEEALWADLPAVSNWFARVQTRPSFAAMERLRTTYAPVEAAA